MHERYTDINARTIDSWADAGWVWGRPVDRATMAAVRRGEWAVYLTPTRAVPSNWFLPCLDNGRLDGVALLGLASGGGQQMPIFAALGAQVTSMDYSTRQIESDRSVAAREGLSIACVQADMTRPFPFPDAAFDLIFHPVSNCYVEDVHPVWRECHRVLRSGGVLLSGLDNGFNFLFDDMSERPLVVRNRLPYNPLRMDAETRQALIDSNAGIQFSHTLEDQIGGQLQAGFLLTDVYEDTNEDPDSIADGIPAFWATRAVKAEHLFDAKGNIC